MKTPSVRNPIIFKTSALHHLQVLLSVATLCIVSSSATANLLRVSYFVPLTEADFGGSTVFGVAPSDTEFSMAFTLDSDDQFLIPGLTVSGVTGINVYAFPKEAMSDIEVNFGTLSLSSDDLQERVYARQGGIEAVADIAFDEPLTVGASPELFLDFEPPGVGRVILGGQSGISTSDGFTTTGLGLGLDMFDTSTGGRIDLSAGGTVTVVPEPETLALAVIVLGALSIRRSSRTRLPRILGTI